MAELEGQMELPVVLEWARQDDLREAEEETELERRAEWRLRAVLRERLERRYFVHGEAPPG